MFEYVQNARHNWENIFNDGKSKILGRQPLKTWSTLADHMVFKFFKGCLPEFLLGPFLNTLYCLNCSRPSWSLGCCTANMIYINRKSLH